MGTKTVSAMVFIGCALALATPAGAAEIDLGSQLSIMGPHLEPFPFIEDVRVDTLTSGQPAASVNQTKSSTATVNGFHQSSSATSKASADETTGILRARVADSYEGYYGRGATGALAAASLSETFTVVGSGTITAHMKVDGSYSVSQKAVPFPPGGGTIVGPDDVSFRLFGGLALHNELLDSFDNMIDPGSTCAPSGCPSALGSVSQLLTTRLDVENGQTITLGATILAQLIAGEGVLDLSHTGLLSLMTSPGLTLLASDPRFLSKSPLGTTPLPATLPLFASALGGLGLISWKRRKAGST